MMNSSVFVICTGSLMVMTVMAVVPDFSNDPDMKGIFVPPVEPLQNSKKTEVFCFMAHSRWADTTIIQQTFPNAERVGLGRLPKHRLDFNGLWKTREGSISTAVPDPGYEVWGAIFYIPMSDLKSVLLKGGICDNERVMKLVQDEIDAFYYSDLRKTKDFYTYEDFKDEFAKKIKCNSFQLNDLPKKMIYGRPLPENRRPSQKYMTLMVESYAHAGIPQEYTEEIKLIPVREKPIES